MGTPAPHLIAPELVANAAFARPHLVTSVTIALPLAMTATAMETYYGAHLQGAVRSSMWRLIEVTSSVFNPFTTGWCVGVAASEPSAVTEPSEPTRRRSRWSMFRM